MWYARCCLYVLLIVSLYSVVVSIGLVLSPVGVALGLEPILLIAGNALCMFVFCAL